MLWIRILLDNIYVVAIVLKEQMNRIIVAIVLNEQMNE